MFKTVQNVCLNLKKTMLSILEQFIFINRHLILNTQDLFKVLNNSVGRLKQTSPPNNKGMMFDSKNKLFKLNSFSSKQSH